MTIVSRDQLHRTVEELPENRLTAAAELLEALAAHDQRVLAWRQTLSSADEAEIATSLRREHTADEWVSDEALAAWIDSDDDVEASPSSGPMSR
jgi:hypothetical protein